MELKFFRPKSEILQQYIEGYYFLTNKSEDSKLEYFTFPNNFSIISIIKNAEIVYAENTGIIKEKQDNPFISDLICHYKKPIKLFYEGNINEITFYFKPLGLNAFLNKPLCTYINNFFSAFIPFTDYKETFNEILEEKNSECRIELIENYWLSKLKGFSHPFLNNVIFDLNDIENEYTVSDLANKYETSRQNLNKHFESNLCKSPSDFKKIQRFREALKSHFQKKPDDNFTSLSYDLLFYDQSHLIKDFKSLTGFTPKKFFERISAQENGEINWLFI